MSLSKRRFLELQEEGAAFENFAAEMFASGISLGDLIIILEAAKQTLQNELFRNALSELTDTQLGDIMQAKWKLDAFMEEKL